MWEGENRKITLKIQASYSFENELAFNLPSLVNFENATGKTLRISESVILFIYDIFSLTVCSFP